MLYSKAKGFGFDTVSSAHKIKCGNCLLWFVKKMADGMIHAKCLECHALNDCSAYLTHDTTEKS
jgi:phage FluMu protein Com